MTDFGRRRIEAWTGLLNETGTVPTPDRPDAPLPRQNATGAQRARSARSACQGARASVVSLHHSTTLGHASGLTREWVECLEELLALADRVFALAEARRA